MSTRPYTPKDHYFQKAKDQGLRARSAFKLEEIFKRSPSLIKKNQQILDLGSAPGSFLQTLSPLVGAKGQVIGIDLSPITKLNLPNVKTIQGDIFDEEFLEDCFNILDIEKFDLITADLSPKTSGIKDIDNYRSYKLNESVLDISNKYLKTGGHLISKIFQGSEFNLFLPKFKKHFSKLTVSKPKACRSRSREVYLIGYGLIRT